jgi:5-methyltetrahydrofolate--homocysteine methyltransferase
MKDNLYHNDSMFKGARPGTFKKAEILRKKMTPSELKLWDTLKNKESVGYRFRRQHPLGHYILDFYNHQLKLCIEVDGAYHEVKEQKIHDQQRDDFLKYNNIHTIRFSNHEVETNIDGVIDHIISYIDESKPLTL